MSTTPSTPASTAPPAARRPRFLTLLWGALTASPKATGGRVLGLHLLLIAAWHAACLYGGEWLCRIAVDVLLSPAALLDPWAISPPEPSYSEIVAMTPVDRLALVVAAQTVLALLGALAYIPFWLRSRRFARPLATFLRCWWRACLWGTALLPIGAALLRLSGYSDLGVFVPVLAPWTLVMPTVAARAERPRWRMVRWRPECPECGYFLRGLTVERCPECGTALPPGLPRPRRWAIRRLIWERRRRPLLPWAYVLTAVQVLLCPCGAARRLVLPDRLGRAVRWAVAHVVVLAVIGALCGSRGFYVAAIGSRLGGEPFFAFVADGEHWIVPAISSLQLSTWLGQSVAAWLVGLALLPALGVALAGLWPGCHPLARRGLVRWSLYASVALVAPWLCGGLQWLGRGISAGVPLGHPTWYVAFHELLGRTLEAWVLTGCAIVYALIWARGVGAHVYTSHRSYSMTLLRTLLFLAAWALLVRVLLPPGALETLL